MSDRVRLHITPFNPDLLDRYIPTSIKPVATNIFFHAVETFPERGFGYVELPVAEAQKLKSKFNGMSLKGSKIKIEEARKEKKRKVEDEDEDDNVEVKKAKKKAKKAKKIEGVLEGHELPEGRIVKRGWTEDAGKTGKDGKVKKEEKKMKFKTSVPPNAVPLEDGKEKKEKADKKDKKEKKEKTPEEKAEKAERKARKKETLVKEFANTTKLNFPNSAGDKKQKHYEEGVGWVDQEGNVLEPEPASTKRKRERKELKDQEKKEKKERKAKKAAEKIPTPEPELEEPAVESDSEEEDVQMEEAASPPTHAEEASSEDDDASPAAASDEDSDNDSLDEHLNQAESNTVSNGATTQPKNATPTPVGDVVEEVDELDNEVAKEVHPLEALYKRDSKPAPIDTSFNFFTAGEDDDGEEEHSFVPQTPHTKEDLEWRSVRSAAPTPDTAAIGKKFNFPPTAAIAEEEDDEEDDEEVEKELGDGKGEESEFRKWFYANRGDLNRGWKKRRKEERKVVRQRENRRASRRVA
jgi:hypothetical protein